MTFTVDGQEEVMEPGDAFYIPPGHLQRAKAGTEYLQFSPAKEMAEVEQQVMKNRTCRRCRAADRTLSGDLSGSN